MPCFYFPAGGEMLPYLDFDVVYSRYQGATMRRALRVLNNNYHDAEDAMQDAWLHIASCWDRLHFDTEEQLSTYIMITIEGRARHILEKQTRIRQILVEEELPEEELSDRELDRVLYDVCARETVEEIKRAVEEMAPIYREVLTLSLLYDFPIAFVAKTLKIKKHTAYMRLRRGKLLLARALGKEDAE